eukprot:TRINITY_DN7679_c0_g2_i2.p1 TRINITY_DN7679_c0_g2~~TRINITY_DN7679_c0_g2_i2.p1  ORF type:complete len:535 (-),score=108.87 TRINITY_DN7679_c0_g2_i2:64-1668(-)
MCIRDRYQRRVHGFVKIAQWREGLDSLTEEELLPKKIFLQRKSTIYELVLKICEEFAVEYEKVILIKKMTSSSEIIPKILTGDPDELSLTLGESLISQGMLLYIEIKDTDQYDLKWIKEFEKEAYYFTIKFNNPLIQEETQMQQEMQQYIKIDSRVTLRDLRLAICKQIGVNHEEILMKRGGKMGQEYKDETKVLTRANLISGSSLYLEFGIPSLQGQFRLIFSLARAKKSSETQFYEFIDLGEWPVDGDLKASELKQKVIEKVKSQQPQLLEGLSNSPEDYRLRERLQERLTRVYRDDKAIKQQGLFDKRLVALEIIDQSVPESMKRDLSKDEYLVNVRRFYPKDWSLSEKIEVIVKKNWNLKQFGEVLKTYWFQDLKIEQMQGHRVLAIWSFNKLELLEKWEDFDNESALVSGYPFYIGQDGFFIIIKNFDEELGELTEDQIKEFGVTEQKLKFQLRDTFKSKPRPIQSKEQGIKIKIKTKVDEEMEEQQQQIDKLTKEEENKDNKEQKVNLEQQQEQKQQPENKDDLEKLF